MSESSIVALAISVLGIFTTYLTVKTTLRADVERATVLRFVETFETTIQGMLLYIDHFICIVPKGRSRDNM